MAYAETLYFLRKENKDRQQIRSMQRMFGKVSLRKQERLQSSRVHFLRDVTESIGAMGESQLEKQDIERHSGCRIAQASNIQGSDREIIYPQEVGWEDLHILLGEWQEEIYSSLSMDMGKGLRSNPSRNGYSSYQSQLLRRQIGKSGTSKRLGAQQIHPRPNKKKIYTCVTCGGEFLSWPRKERPNKYCSPKCYHSALRSMTSQ